MGPTLSTKLLNEAVRIGDQLLAEAKRNPEGLSWETIDPLAEKGHEWLENETIYNGVCGILLFFMELYRQTKDSKYLEAALEGEKWTDYRVKSKKIKANIMEIPY